MGHKIRQYYLPLLRYHLRIIFGGKFIYFVVASVGLFLLTSLLSLFGEGAFPNNADVYGFLLFPGLLLIFYPSAFGIQNELDAKT
ncbi:MAG TPA: hypothetical protein PKV71_20865, partial [Calditrichia bacterium]|nr:hypothetical protein [Calditrichia bacterium]